MSLHTCLKQSLSRIHKHTQSQGLCGATKATETQELIIVIAVESATQTQSEAHSHRQTHNTAGSLILTHLSINLRPPNLPNQIFKWSLMQKTNVSLILFELEIISTSLWTLSKHELNLF